MFDGFAPKYFEHVHKVMFKKQPSVLGMIYGMFEIKSKTKTSYYIAMENISFGSAIG